MQRLLFLLLPLCLISTSQARIWTTTTGKLVEADLVKASRTHVLLRSGKKMSTAPISAFIPEDQKYIRAKLAELAAKKPGAKGPIAGSLAETGQAAMQELLAKQAEIDAAKADKIEADRQAFIEKMAKKRAEAKKKGKGKKKNK